MILIVVKENGTIESGCAIAQCCLDTDFERIEQLFPKFDSDISGHRVERDDWGYETAHHYAAVIASIHPQIVGWEEGQPQLLIARPCKFPPIR